MSRLRRVLATSAIVASAMSILTGCASSDDSGDTIRFALDWTPNTNHTGLYVALQEGYFADAGLNVEVLPYNNTSPDTLVDAGNAEFGTSFQDSATFSRAAGAQTVSVLAPLQHGPPASGSERTAPTSRARGISTARRTPASATRASGRRCAR
ncbi:ABC transporter substrate-binding protein [Prescottella equi]|nr:ABC transporter substrate-binding protein [Prescottella equi]